MPTRRRTATGSALAVEVLAVEQDLALQAE